MNNPAQSTRKPPLVILVRFQDHARRMRHCPSKGKFGMRHESFVVYEMMVGWKEGANPSGSIWRMRVRP